MTQQFYIAINNQQEGPFTLEELKAKGIHRKMLVWTTGLDGWTQAENIPSLKEIIMELPPPLPNSEEKKSSQEVPPIQKPNVSKTEYFGYELAKRKDRFLAALLDAVIIYMPCYVLYTVLIDPNSWYTDYGYFSAYSIRETIGWSFLSMLLGAIFYPLWSGNLGHKIMGLKVISSADGTDKTNAADGAIRETLKALFSLVLVPIIWIFWDKEKQNLYDKVVKTYVVKIKEE